MKGRRGPCSLETSSLGPFISHSTSIDRRGLVKMAITRRPTRDAAEGASSINTTRLLLICGVALAPLFYILAVGQILTRPGFDIRRHIISMLALGDQGWIQTANFEITGLLAVTCAVGV